MDKRYQVFVSSTYADLKDERRAVMQALMEMDCIPAGMELFPAADEEQWRFIQRVIDDCDYYLLIIGGRYGSLTEDGMSYTEREFDYAVTRGLHVVALLHERPDEITVRKSDIDPALRAKLATFRNKVATGRLVKFWNSTGELPGMVALSLQKAMKTYPAVGWVRADRVANVDALTELNELRKKNAEVEKELVASRATAAAPALELAPLSDPLVVRGHLVFGNARKDWAATVTWEDIFGLVAPRLMSRPSDQEVQSHLALDLHRKHHQNGHSPTLDDQIFQTIKLQLIAHRLVSVDYLKTVSGGMGLFWTLTDKGQQQMMKLRVIPPK
jgi:hypothetical protein